MHSAPLQAFYDLAFAKDGDAAAGTALHGILNLVFRYKGSVFYKMQAGMGETVFAPLYQVLKARGVRFEFFHRVDDLRLDPSGSMVDEIELAKQVDLIRDYEPLRDVDGLPCWPSEPRHEFLKDGDRITAGRA